MDQMIKAQDVKRLENFLVKMMRQASSAGAKEHAAKNSFQLRSATTNYYNCECAGIKELHELVKSFKNF